MNALEFSKEAILKLNKTKSFAEEYVSLRMEFCRRFQNGLIFSTRFGADFFNEVSDRIRNKKPIEQENNQTVGEYDLNFNKWLKQLKI